MRTLWVDYDEQGQRYKEWRRVVAECTETKHEDSPVQGPPSCLHMMKHWERHGGNPRLWLDVWCRNRNISQGERVYHELSVLLELFYVGGTYDQLNMGCLVCFEVAARRIQSVIDAYSQDPSKPQWNNARLYSGVSSAMELVSPELRHYVARRAKEEIEVDTMRTRNRTLGLAADASAAGGLPEAAPQKPGGKGAKGKDKGAAGGT